MGGTMSGIAQAAVVGGAVGCGVAGGVFFAFSSFVMGALRRLPDADGIAAMQSVNREAVTPLFMTALFGTAALCLALAVWAVRARGVPASGWVLAGALLYLVGAIAVTALRNVPLNAPSRPWTRRPRIRPGAGMATCATGPAGTTSGRWRAPARRWPWPWGCVSAERRSRCTFPA